MIRELTPNLWGSGAGGVRLLISIDRASGAGDQGASTVALACEYAKAHDPLVVGLDVSGESKSRLRPNCAYFAAYWYVKCMPLFLET